MKELNIKITHLQKSFCRPVLKDINLDVTNDSYIAVMGQSGSGKSTLLNILGLVEGYDAGEYIFNGECIKNGIDYAHHRQENIGFIFQSYNLINSLTCKENILLPTIYNRKNTVQSLDDLVEQLNIGALLDQRVNTLSGGEKQRVAIARALILNPCLILADEPTGNLDAENKKIIFHLLDAEHKRGRGILLITHDERAASHAKTTYILQNGVLEHRQISNGHRT